MKHNDNPLLEVIDSMSKKPRLLLINPANPLVTLTRTSDNWTNQYRVWKPLSLLVLAGATPSDWDIEVIDENRGIPDYGSFPRHDLVGIRTFPGRIW